MLKLSENIAHCCRSLLPHIAQVGQTLEGVALLSHRSLAMPSFAWFYILNFLALRAGERNYFFHPPLPNKADRGGVEHFPAQSAEKFLSPARFTSRTLFPVILHTPRSFVSNFRIVRFPRKAVLYLCIHHRLLRTLNVPKKGNLRWIFKGIPYTNEIYHPTNVEEPP